MKTSDKAGHRLISTGNNQAPRRTLQILEFCWGLRGKAVQLNVKCCYQSGTRREKKTDC
jgi:hypothetical protein